MHPCSMGLSPVYHAVWDSVLYTVHPCSMGLSPVNTLSCLIVPVTYAWKDELEKKAHNAISKALGQTPMLPAIQPQQGYMTTNNSSTKHEFDSLDDTQVRE